MDYRKFLQWGLSHLDEIPALYSLATAIPAPPPYSPTWAAINPLGVKLTAIADTFPAMDGGEFSTLDATALEAKFTEQGLGDTLKKLLEIWKKVKPILDVIGTLS